MQLIKEAFKKTIIGVGSRLIGKQRFSNVVAAIGRCSDIDLSIISSKHLELYPQSESVGSQQFLNKVFNAFYSQSDPNLIIPTVEIGSAVSYSPIIENIRKLF